ncbi:hypothetical protein ACGF5O_34075 [Streptomyces sp. NPDC048291]|uniref:hypothetical protein n=1 Tax=Streptomyces sp. NPDC048291 TaxID=3365530 RepID=UPI0037152F1E
MAPVALLVVGRTRNRGAVPYVRAGADEHPAARPPAPGRSLPSTAGTGCPPGRPAVPRAPDRTSATRTSATRSATTRHATTGTPSAPAPVRV